MKLMVSQNKPFHPIYDDWKAGSRQMLDFDDTEARKQVEEMDAKVLSNRRPPYPPIGGLFDALTDTNGDVLLAGNEEAASAAKLFEKTEGIDIHPAAGVATASLIQAVNNNLVEKDAIIMLNITGGGEERFARENELVFLKPDIIFDLDPDAEEVHKKLQGLF
jgi:cysteate synthase